MFKNTMNKFCVILLIISMILFPAITNATEKEEHINQNSIKLATNEDEPQEEEIDDTYFDGEDYTTQETNDDDDENAIESKEVKNGDVCLSGKSVTIDYNVDGNLFIFANDVKINSQISGDAFIIANSLTIEEDAYIYNNLFTCSNNLDIKGAVYEVYSIAKTANIVSGYIDRDLKISCDTLNLQGDIGRNAMVSCDSITLENSEENSYSTIGGDFIYSAKNKLENIPEYIVSGETKFTPNVFNINIGASNYIISAITVLCFVSLVWLCLLYLSPKFLSSSSQIIKEKKGLVAITSICTLILIPIVSIILMFTNVFSSFALLLIALYCILISLGSAISTIVINKFVCNKFNVNKKVATWGILLLVSLVLWIIGLIPFVGSIISFVLTLCGMGIILSYILPIKKSQSI